jgi:hypothetical protein
MRTRQEGAETEVLWTAQNVRWYASARSMRAQPDRPHHYDSGDRAEEGGVTTHERYEARCTMHWKLLTMQKQQKGHGLAHREGRTRSLQILVVAQPCTRHKSLTLYPIKLGGR